jgi:hypothetical protein
MAVTNKRNIKLINELVVVVIVLIFCLFNIYTTIALTHKSGFGFISYTIDRTIYLLTHSQESLISNIFFVIQNYLMSTITVVIMLLILMSRPFIIGKHEKLTPIYNGAYIGFCLGCFLQGSMNLWGMYVGDTWIPLAFNSSLALIVFTISSFGGFILSFLPEIKRIAGSHIMTYAIIFSILSLVLVLVFIGTGVLNIPLSSPEVDSSQSISDILSDAVQKLTGNTENGSNQSVLPGGVDPLEIIALALTAFIFILITLAFVAIRSGITISQIIMIIIGSIARRNKVERSENNKIPQSASPELHSYFLQSAEYKDDIRKLSSIAVEYGYDNVEYINNLNAISKRYDVNTANIIYDEWCIRKGV